MGQTTQLTVVKSTSTQLPVSDIHSSHYAFEYVRVDPMQLALILFTVRVIRPNHHHLRLSKSLILKVQQAVRTMKIAVMMRKRRVTKTVVKAVLKKNGMTEEQRSTRENGMREEQSTREKEKMDLNLGMKAAVRFPKD